MALLLLGLGRPLVVFLSLLSSLLLIVVLPLPVASDLCFSDGIPPAERKNLTINSVSLPIGFYRMEWESAYLVAEVVRVILEEVLGYNTTLTGGSGTTADGVFELTGCYYGANWQVVCPDGSLDDDHPHHVCMEVWLTTDLYHRELALLTDQRLPEMYDLGYEGYEGQYVAGAIRDEALSEEGWHLDFFGDYDVNWTEPWRYFSNYTEIDKGLLTWCGYTTLVNLEQMEFVKRWTPDPEGFNGTSGEGHCEDGYWWLSPACRDDTSRCIPFLTWGSFYYPQVMQRAIAHNMPIALASWNDWGDYINGPSFHRIMTYSWTPSIHYMEIDPHRIIFPASDEAAIAEGDYRTQFAGTTTYTVIAPMVYEVAPRVSEVLSRVQFLSRHVEKLLDDYWWSWYDLRGTACKWLQENEWDDWIPEDTKCTSGEGMVDADGGFQSNRSFADGCSPCTPGHYSSKLWDDGGSTFTCEPCEAGMIQPLYESTSCNDCDEGYYQDAEGQSACQRCPKGTYANATRSISCTSCPEGKTTQGTGFRLITDCLCPSGTYSNSEGECKSCGEGSSCSGFGEEPEALAGYHLAEVREDGLWIFACTTDPDRCPGGPVGTCATGRQGYACAECRDGWSTLPSGECGPCSSGDAIPGAVAITLAVIVVVAVHVYSHKEEKLQQTKVGAIIFLTTAQMVLVLQLVGVLTRINIEWPEPMKSFKEYFGLFLWNYEELVRFSCVAYLSSLEKYVLKLMAVPAVSLILCIMHFVTCFVKYPDQWNSRWFALYSAVGLVVNALYISMSVLILSPFQCTKHPNNVWTMIQYQGVICWNSSEHESMMGISSVASIIPLGFLAAVFFVLYTFDRRMSNGDVEYLRRFSWLLVRVRPESRWFVFFNITRNLLVALVPIIPLAFWQTFTLEVLFVVSIVAIVEQHPGKSALANGSDLIVNSAILCVMFLSAPFLPEEDGSQLPEATVAILMGLFIAFPLYAVSFIASRIIQGHRRRYTWFLCHQKSAAGAFARLLKICLIGEARAVGGSVFLDADDLLDLSKLFEFVRSDVKTLLVLASREIFTSIWCLGEVTTASTHKVNMMTIHFPDFVIPDDRMLEDVPKIPGLEKLLEHGTVVTDVRKALQNFSACAFIRMPEMLDEQQLGQITTWVLRRSVTRSNTYRSSTSGHKDNDYQQNSILADLSNTEAVSSALILSRLLGPLLSTAPKIIPKVLGPAGQRQFPAVDSSQILVLMCTTNCLSSHDYLVGVADAFIVHKIQHVLPVVASDVFQFPCQSFYRNLENALTEAGRFVGVDIAEPRALNPVVRSIFQKICPRLSVMGSSEVLVVQTRLIMRNLLAPEGLQLDRVKLQTNVRTQLENLVEKANSDGKALLVSRVSTRFSFVAQNTSRQEGLRTLSSTTSTSLVKSAETGTEEEVRGADSSTNLANLKPGEAQEVVDIDQAAKHNDEEEKKEEEEPFAWSSGEEEPDFSI